MSAMALACANAVSELSADTGELHRTLQMMMTNNPAARKVTALPLVKAAVTACKWYTAALVLENHGVHEEKLTFTPDNCSSLEHSKEFQRQTFPCELTRGANRTMCVGPLRVDGTWDRAVEAAAANPGPWPRNFPPPPAANSVRVTWPSKPYDRKLNCESLSGLTVARAVQRTGVYAGTGTLTCEVSSRGFQLRLEGSGVEFRHSVRAAHKNPLLTSVPAKNVSWEAAFNGRGHLLVSLGDGAVRYNKRQLSGERTKLEGKMRYSVSESKTLEPRLCTLSSLTGACSVLQSLPQAYRKELGNATGFNVKFWYPQAKAVSIEGYVFGTKGVMFVGYVARIADPDELAWMELPLDLKTRCASRVYRRSDCANLPHGAPRLGAYELIEPPTFHGFDLNPYELSDLAVDADY